MLIDTLEFIESITGLPDDTKAYLIFTDEFEQTDTHCLLTYFDADECARAAAIMHSKQRHVYCVTRFVLKQLIAETCDINIMDIHIQTDALGKPYLPDSGIHFNVSHSQNMAMVAISQRLVGVDIELIKAKRNIDGIAKKITSTAEYTWYNLDDSLHRFYTLWSLKEARLKCDGVGIRYDFPEVTFDVDGEPTYPGYDIHSGIIELNDDFSCAICIANIF